MGKDLKGKEIGEGVMQRKDGRYSARYRGCDGKRHEKYFDKVSDAKRFVTMGRFQAEENISGTETFTGDQWFDYWIRTFKRSLSPNTIRNYKERYEINIKPAIGTMPITQVRAMHCQQIFNKMEEQYAAGTIYQTYVALGSMLKSALVNDIISKHPMDGVVMPRRKKKSEIHFLTVDEQDQFLAAADNTRNAPQFSLILQTGLRTGELIGLTWDCVDFENRTITVNKSLEFRYKRGYWRAGPPKTMSGFRTIPMTEQAYDILKRYMKQRRSEKKLLFWNRFWNILIPEAIRRRN